MMAAMSDRAGNAPERQAAERFGRLGEGLAGLLLRLKGYQIVAKRYRAPVGEIDLILRRGGVLVFAEVKARTEKTDNRGLSQNSAGGITSRPGADALTQRQRDRIVRAAEAFVQSRPDLSQLDWRFDLVLVNWPSGLRHLKDAWRPGLP